MDFSGEKINTMSINVYLVCLYLKNSKENAPRGLMFDKTDKEMKRLYI